jgi:hypothetical protein
VEHRKPITVSNLLARGYSNRNTLFKSEHQAPGHGVLAGLKGDRQEILRIGFRDFGDWFFVVSDSGGARNWTEGAGVQTVAIGGSRFKLSEFTVKGTVALVAELRETTRLTRLFSLADTVTNSTAAILSMRRSHRLLAESASVRGLLKSSIDCATPTGLE